MRFWGQVGLNRGEVETAPGVYEQKIEEVDVRGDIRFQKVGWPQQTMNELTARHTLSIVTPEDSLIDFTEAVYICWQGRRWAVKSIEYKRPRVELAFGGIYHG